MRSIRVTRVCSSAARPARTAPMQRSADAKLALHSEHRVLC